MKKNYFTPETKVMTINSNVSIMEDGLAASGESEGMVATEEPLF